MRATVPPSRPNLNPPPPTPQHFNAPPPPLAASAASSPPPAAPPAAAASDTYGYEYHDSHSQSDSYFQTPQLKPPPTTASDIPIVPWPLHPTPSGPTTLYSTAMGNSSSPPPPASSPYLVHDMGNASPKLLRCNTFILPQNSATARRTALGMYLLSTPLGAPPAAAFAVEATSTPHESKHNVKDKPKPNEEDVDLEAIPILQGTSPPNTPSQAMQPIRCTHCSAYLNPYCQIPTSGTPSSRSRSSNTSSLWNRTVLFIWCFVLRID